MKFNINKKSLFPGSNSYNITFRFTFMLIAAIVLEASIFVKVSLGNTSILISDSSRISLTTDIKFKTARQIAFERVFGDVVRLDTAMVEKVKNEKPGKRNYSGFDMNGKPSEVWFIDTDPRHQEHHRPILVKVIDEDGDLYTGKEPDFDSDLYIVDWNANGNVDVIVDYEDLDGDGDVDRMGMFWYGSPRIEGDEISGLSVWWSRDDGDDNMLWYNVDYKYDQSLCQYRTNFGGNETFCDFYFNTDKNLWIPHHENPFLFFDNNNDGLTDEIIRIKGEGNIVKTFRWSFDAGNNATKDNPRNFDVGISAFPPGWSPDNDNSDLSICEEISEKIMIRGIPSKFFADRSKASGFFDKVTWGRVMLTWDEEDLNRAWDNNGDTIERWEGIIAHPSLDPDYYMPKIGGPVCSPYNKRYELVLTPSGPNEFYYNSADHRIHIKSCDKSWIDVDFDRDGKSDMYYNWVDSDNDGILDKIELDANSDGVIDDFWDIDIFGINTVPWTFEGLNNAYAPVIIYEPSRKYLLSKALTEVLESISERAGKDLVWDLIQNRMQGEHFTREVSHKFINSDVTMLFYLELVCDRQIVKLKNQKTGSQSFWTEFNTARSKNDVESMIQVLCKEFRVNAPEQDYKEWLGHLRKEPDRPKVAWNNEWAPPNWGWESEKAAFRFYSGHFDLFGKRIEQLIYPNIKQIKKVSYHLNQNEWGMDILEIGNSSGCGGLVLYVDGEPYPVRTPVGQDSPVINGRLVEETFDKISIELIAKEIVPDKPYTIKIRPSAFANREDSPIEVIVEGGSPGETIELGIGLTRLPEETFIFNKAAGVMGSWGFQNPEIGWIGMGVIFPPDLFIRLDQQPEEHRVVLRCEIGEPLTYHIQGRWLKGLRFSCCPSAKDWADVLKLKAHKILLK